MLHVTLVNFTHVYVVTTRPLFFHKSLGTREVYMFDVLSSLLCIAAYAAAILFCLSEDSRRQAAAPNSHSGIIRNDVSC